MHGQEIKATWMRGGTSKCWVFDRAELQVPGHGVDEVLLRLFGSPDPRQVDGVGGGTSTTSKAVIVSPSASPDADVDYTFAQVGIEEAVVDWGSNCGNCSAVVGHYALRRGWVPRRAGTTSVRVRNTNTGQLIVLDVPGDDEPLTTIPGVSFPGDRVRMWFVDPAGRTTGSVLPTGNPRDVLGTPDGDVEVTLVDAGAPVVMVAASSVGLRGDETPAALDSDPSVLLRLDAVRRAGAVRMGLAETVDTTARAIPKLVVVSAPTDGCDLRVRMMSMGKTHPALAITGSVGITVAAATAGTVAADLTSFTDGSLLLSTPAGRVETLYGEHEMLPAVGVVRTARELAEARLVIGPDLLDVSQEHLEVAAR